MIALYSVDFLSRVRMLYFVHDKICYEFDCKDGHIHSTTDKHKRATESEAEEFVVATETGILHRMCKENPRKKFYPAKENSVCEYMKMITPEKFYNTLKGDRHKVKVPGELTEQAYCRSGTC